MPAELLDDEAHVKRREYMRKWYQTRGNARARQRYADESEFKARKKATNKASYARRAPRYTEFMVGKVCEVCGEARTHVLEWHHLDPLKKDSGILQALLQRGWESMLDEVAKCQLLCANCHKDAHFKLSNGEYYLYNTTIGKLKREFVDPPIPKQNESPCV